MTLDQRNSPKLLLGITGGLVVIIMLFLAYQWFFATSNEVLPEHEAASLTMPAKPAASAEVKLAEPEVATDEKTLQLVDETILKAAVPENESLAKEEVAKLADIQKQLKDQETLLKAQHADADDLVALKEEQIKLLEAQLAQKQ